MDRANALTSLQERLLYEIHWHQGMNFPAALWWNKQVVFNDWWELYLHGFIQRGEYKNEMVVSPAGVDYLKSFDWI